MLQVYRTITVDIDLGGKPLTVEIPFTVELLRRVEETIHQCEGRVWFRASAREKSILEAFEKFAREFLPGIDLSQAQPDFSALFFSRVRDELMTSIGQCIASMRSTAKPPEPTAERTTEAAQASA